MTRGVEILAWIGHRIGKPPGWERVARFFASPEKCRGMRDICLVRDESIFIAQPSVPLGWHITLFGTYEPELREVFRGVLSAGGVAVDVGANVGWHTLLMARLVGRGGRVVAAEANPSVRARLVEHLQVNRMRHVVVIPHALGDSDGRVGFRAPDAGDPGAGDGHVVAASENSGDGVIEVETKTLDSIVQTMAVERLDLIKVDVEGFEWPVLKGAEESIARFRPHVIFEYVGEYSGRGGGTPRILADFFAKHRYRLFAIGRNGAEAIPTGHWPSNANVWAMPLSSPDAPV